MKIQDEEFKDEVATLEKENKRNDEFITKRQKTDILSNNTTNLMDTKLEDGVNTSAPPAPKEEADKNLVDFEKATENVGKSLNIVDSLQHQEEKNILKNLNTIEDKEQEIEEDDSTPTEKGNESSLGSEDSIFNEENETAKKDEKEITQNDVNEPVNNENKEIKTQNDEAVDNLPILKVRKILRLDKDFKKCNNETSKMVGKATVSLLNRLIEKSLDKCKENKKKTLFLSDIKEAIQDNVEFSFLAELFEDDNLDDLNTLNA